MVSISRGAVRIGDVGTHNSAELAMKQYLLSIYQPDGPAPSPEFLEPIMRKVFALHDEMKQAGALVFTGGFILPAARQCSNRAGTKCS